MGMFNNSSSARASSVFGNYDILETVGQGGMGVVYRAHDVALDRIVAVKVLKDDLRTQKSIAARFQREGEACATLNHANIVHIYSVGVVGKIPYIAMQYVEGEPLSRMMKRVKRIKWDQAMAIAEQIAEALACAHDAQIIHRDIKPGNILMDKEGKAFVTDFGIAKVLTAETQLTIDGSRLGTPQYMSPERCQNKTITASSDIYSLGVLLFQMISGKLPYSAETPVSLINEITSKPPKRLREYVPSVPKDVERLVAYMLEKDPKNRPASGHDLAEAIGRVRKGRPLVEGESGLSWAMEQLRGHVATPHSHLDAPTAILSKEPGPLERVLEWRPRIPKTIQRLLLSGLVIIAAAAAGVFIGEWLNRGYAVNLGHRMDSSTIAWQRTATPADFLEESPGVVSVRINLEDFHVTRGGWLDENRAVLIVEGNERTHWKGHVAALVLNVEERASNLSIAPIHLGVGHDPVRVLSARASGMSPIRRGTVIIPGTTNSFATAYGLRDSADSELGLRPSVFRGSVSGPVALSPVDAKGVAGIPIQGDAGQWRLVEFSTGRASFEYAQSFPLTEAGPPIVWVDYSPDGAFLFYARRLSDDQLQLWTTSSAGRSGNGRLLYRGNFEIGEGAIGPAGDRLLISETRPGAPPLSLIVGTKRRTEQIELKDLREAKWGPTEQIVIGIAPDRVGHDQLWAVWVESGTRRQVTFLSEGVDRVMAISPDGRWALAEAHENEFFGAVLVSLDDLAATID